MVVDQDNFYSKSEYSHYLFGMDNTGVQRVPKET